MQRMDKRHQEVRAAIIPILQMRRGLLASVIAAIVVALTVGAAEARPVKSLLEMRRNNVVIQNFDLSCGAAALATILNYQHGDPVDEREIAIGLMNRPEYVSNPALVQIREGFSLLDLKRYVERRGYQGIGFGRLTLDSLVERAPVMVPINTHGYNHFVVFRGVLGNRVLLADPSWGTRTMTIARFESAWIDYPEIGHVGFVVRSPHETGNSNVLAPHPREFLSLR
jgi:uncharacterized protein